MGADSSDASWLPIDLPVPRDTDLDSVPASIQDYGASVDGLKAAATSAACGFVVTASNHLCPGDCNAVDAFTSSAVCLQARFMELFDSFCKGAHLFGFDSVGGRILSTSGLKHRKRLAAAVRASRYGGFLCCSEFCHAFAPTYR